MQNLTLKNFLGIEHANVRLDGLTVLIGPQASGKSVVARLFYFCNEYFADFDELALMKNEHKKTYDSRKKEDFYKIFPPYSWTSDHFEILYENESHSLEIVSKKGSATVEIRTSDSVAQAFRSAKKSFQEFSKSFEDNAIHSPSRILREFRRQQPDTLFQLRHEHALFVPASRSFYSTIREEIFSILSIDEKIDQIIMQFGEFYETAKYRMMIEADRNRPIDSREQVFRKYFDTIIKGRFSKVDDRDFIQMERGRIELSKASSGQQEALPLLVALTYFPQPNRTLIIEEPEAHLFPTAQATILDFIVSQTLEQRCDMLFTTHSPYMLTSLNNFILRNLAGKSGGIEQEKVNAYSLNLGETVSIVDQETGLVSADYIDEVSENIEAEFTELMDIFT
ncbi:ATP-binding protein [Paracoccus sp. YLB-12]|uniref:ATP-binding protein n=1 Tax=Paracoccus maritimus TaxID=2933292 RepID=A0ABT2K8N4_9RHOB|nr:ATP-binding protein [Paracoccus sp. YLB-12]MCT4332623.1 ATP-binding protein [Paracoccus sp. YLB-12]